VRSIRLDVEPLALPLKHAFTIARSSEVVARTVLIRLHWNGIDALGESAPSERYGESVDSVAAGLAALDAGDDPYALDRLLSGLPAAEACGLDIALHDCIGKDLDRPLWRLLGVDPARTPMTSFTIGIAPLDETLAKVREVGSHPIIKVKLGKGAEIETLEAIRAIYTGTLRVDANEAWSPEQSVALLHEMERFEIALAAALDSRALADTDRERRGLQRRARLAGAPRLRRRHQREAGEVRRDSRGARHDPYGARDGV
jgi:L-alanine-DL-glutamate epimerase-like enolase superfamily enzyme